MKESVNYAWPVTTMCKYDAQALKECVEKNDAVFSKNKIVIFGAGIRGTFFSILLKRMGFHNICFVDNNAQKVGGCMNEYQILPYGEIIKEKGNAVILISVENGFSIAEQLERDGFQREKDFFYIESHLYDRYLAEFLREGKVETLIMGDCGLTDISLSDDDDTNLSELLKQNLGERTKILAMHAMGMRAFYHILSAHIQCVGIPERAVVMANFETFTGKQHLLPRSQHARLIRMVSEAVRDENEGLKEYARIAEERFENFRMDYFASSQSAVNSMSKEKNDRIVMKMNYMYGLKEDNECIVYLKKMKELCRENGISLLFFIPPVNYAYGEALWGQPFLEKYGDNVKKLEEVIRDGDTELLDLSFTLTPDCFADKRTIDETTNYAGRKRTVEKMVEKIVSMR